MIAVPVVLVIAAVAAVLVAGGDSTSPVPTTRGSADLVLSAPAAGSSVADTTPMFAGTMDTENASSRVTVRVYAGSQVSGNALRRSRVIADSAGQWSIEDGAPLAPGSYTVRAVQRERGGGVRMSTPVTFTVSTPPEETDDAPALIAAGDIATCGSIRGDEDTAALLSKTTGAIQTIGDNAYDHGSTAEFRCFDSSWGRYKARIHPSLGDHEYDLGNANPYFRYFGAAAGERGKGYYSYNLGSWHIVVTNPNCGKLEGGCRQGGAQEQWLREDLARNPRQCALAVIGGPLFSSGKVHGSESSYEDFWKTLYDEGADVVLSADDHVYERFAPQTPDGMSDTRRGIRQFTVGTGGYFLYPFAAVKPLSEERQNRTHGLLRLVLRPTSYDWRFHSIAGSTYTDVGSSECH